MKLKYQDNKQAIQQRILGALVMHIIASEMQTNMVDAIGLKALTRTINKTENLIHYYRDTLGKVDMFFETNKIDGKYSDFQANLCLELGNIYN